MNERLASESTPTAAEPQASEPLEKSSKATTSATDFAAKAADLEAIRKAVDDAASVGGALWLSYLFVLFYLAVATGAVTHTDLFFENAVKLPFLNIELPLLAFFFLAPVLFIIMHAYALLHLVMLTEKAKRFHHKNDPEDERAESLRWQLPSNIFIQLLAGPADIRSGHFGTSLRAIAWITLVIAPVLLLLMMQIQFLAFHSSFITWTHRVILVADLGLLWWLWRKILWDEVHDDPTRRPSLAWTVVCRALTLCVVLFSWTAATFSGEWQDDHWPDWRLFPTSDDAGRPIAVSFHDWVFNSKVDPTTRRRWLPFSSTLVLTGFNIYEGLGIDDPDKAKWHDFVFRARGRNLRGAIFDLATLPKVDFEGADLRGASLNLAQVEHADEWPGAEVAIERERLRDGRTGFGIGPVAIANRAGLRSRRKAQTMSFIAQLLGLGKAAANGKLRTAADVERALGILVDECAVANKAVVAAADERRRMLLSMRGTTRSPSSNFYRGPGATWPHRGAFRSQGRPRAQQNPPSGPGRRSVSVSCEAVPNLDQHIRVGTRPRRSGVMSWKTLQ